jgi:hypothetical protein
MAVCFLLYLIKTTKNNVLDTDSIEHKFEKSLKHWFEKNIETQMKTIKWRWNVIDK